jgi:hypothetical protein
MTTMVSPPLKQTAQRPLTAAQLIRWSGLVNIAAGIFFALETLLHPVRDIFNARTMIQQTVLGVPWNVVHTFAILAFVLSLFGLVGLYIRLFERVGWIGFTGFVLSFVGLALGIGVVVPDAFLFPVFAHHDSTAWLLMVPGILIPGGEFGVYLILSGIILVAGTILFCLAGIRARVLPVWGFFWLGVGISLVTFGPLADNSLGLAGAVVGAIGYIWLGYALWSETPHQAVK